MVTNVCAESDFATLAEFMTALESVRAKNKDTTSVASCLPQLTPSTGAATAITASASGNNFDAYAASASGESPSAAAGYGLFVVLKMITVMVITIINQVAGKMC